MRHFKNYDRSVVPEDVIQNAIMATHNEWALDWIGAEGPGWWRIMWAETKDKWPPPTQSRALLRELSERGLIGIPESEIECVIAVHRVDRLAVPKWVGRVEMESPIKVHGDVGSVTLDE